MRYIVIIAAAFCLQVAAYAFLQVDELARERITHVNGRVDKNDEAIKEIIAGQARIQSRMDMGLGGLALLGMLAGGQFVLTWKRGRHS